MFDPNVIDWSKINGMLPAIIQDANNGNVLMLGFMNDEALAETIKRNKVVFYSRSKRRLWQKGESSGNTLDLVSLSLDCDADAILVLAVPQGPTCHQGSTSCFEKNTFRMQFLSELESIIASRKHYQGQNSYVADLLQEGLIKIAQKVGEEAVETVLAATTQTNQDLLNEAADLIFHLQVLLAAKELSLLDVISVLKSRH